MPDTPSAANHARPIRRTAVIAVAALLLGLVAVPATASASASRAEVRSERYERTVLARINRVRHRQDLPRLRVLPCVDVLAERRVATPLRPARAARLDGRRLRSSCDRTLELATSRSGPARLVARAWLHRPRTRSALLDRDARFVGVAAVPARGRWRVTLLVAGARLSAPAPGSVSDPATTPEDEGGTSGEGGTTTDGTVPADGTDPTTGETGDTGEADATTEPTTDEAAAMDELELAVLEATNRRRANHGLTPLVPSGCAADFAGEHSATMAQSGSFAHASLTELRSSCGGESLAENIAMVSGTTVTARALVQMWMESPGHRANILDPDLTHLGVGIAYAAGSDRWYATQDFLGNP